MSIGPALTRKEFLISALATASVSAFAGEQGTPTQTDDITEEDLKAAEKLFGLQFTPEERKAVLSSVRASRRNYEALRAAPITYQIEPPTVFTPLAPHQKTPVKVEAKPSASRAARPSNLETLAHSPVRDLAHLIRTKQVTSPTSFEQSRFRQSNLQRCI
jgi:hypothetical protein